MALARSLVLFFVLAACQELPPPATCRSDGALGSCCEQADDCTASLACLTVGDRRACSAVCDPTGGEPACPDGAACVAQDGAPACVSETGLIGDPCAFTDDCRPGLLCENRFPGGYCTAECDKGLPCPSGAGETRCVRLSNDYGTYCLAPCTVAADCADGVVCTPVGSSGVSVCFPDLE